MERERLTEELLHELLDAPTVDSFLGSHELPDISLSDYLQQLLEEKHLKRVRVVRMADLNETFGYQIFTGQRGALGPQVSTRRHHSLLYRSSTFAAKG